MTDLPGSDCCHEYERAAGVNRRSFLKAVAATSGAVVAGQLFGDAFRQTVFGAVGGNVMVVISFRGGIDGLGVVVPHGDAAYYAARPTIAIPRSTLLAQDAMFGLHPGLAPLEFLWSSGELAAVHAVGLPAPNRSHFSAMEAVEDADPGSAERTGWINRMISQETDPTPVDGVQVGSLLVPTSLVGATPTLAVNKMSQMRIAGLGDVPQGRYDSLRTLWQEGDQPLERAARSAVDLSSEYGATLAGTYSPQNGAVYPATGFGDALKDTAKLIRADLGTQAVTIDLGGWDMHASYGTLESGQMKVMLPRFAQTLAAFMIDLGPTLRQRVTVVTISEFGRRVAENGNQGLDHGWGNMMLLAGGGVKGGRYYGRWPSLSPGRLQDGDLKVTTDYRQVLGEVIASRFPQRDRSTIFPDIPYAPLGIMA